MNQLFTLVLCVAVAGACAYYAKRQGRSPVAWFVLGLLFGIFALFVLFFLPMVRLFLAKRARKKNMQVQKSEAPSVFTWKIDSCGLDKMWYYVDRENKQRGPMSFQAFKKAREEGDVLSSTYVWNEDLSDWKKFDEMFI